MDAEIFTSLAESNPDNIIWVAPLAAEPDVPGRILRRSTREVRQHICFKALSNYRGRPRHFPMFTKIMMEEEQGELLSASHTCHMKIE